MPQTFKEVDAVVIGVGFAGSILAKELAATGLKVVGLERGHARHGVPDFQAPAIYPMRQWEAFLPGTGLGGSGVHWNGQIWRYQVADFIYKSHVEQRYGKKFPDPDLRIQDWGLTYQELEPYYDRFEYLLGACGKAGNLNGQIEQGGNPLEAPRSREYPNPKTKCTP